MSIYVTLWALQFPKSDQYHIDCDWVTVVAQGVPAHVGAEGVVRVKLLRRHMIDARRGAQRLTAQVSMGRFWLLHCRITC
jgi:hypothetical protein